MGRKKKEEKNSYLYSIIGSIVLIFFGTLTIISQFQPQQTGLKSFLVNSVGLGSVPFGLLVIVVGVHISPLINVKWLNKRVVAGFFVLFLSSLIVDGLLSTPSMLGSFLGNLTKSMVGFYGALITFFMLTFLGLYLIFSSNFIGVFTKIFNKTKGFKFDNLSFNLKKAKKDSETLDSELTSELDFNFDSNDFSVNEDSTRVSQDEISPEEIKKKDEDFEIVDSLSEPVELIKSGGHTKSSIDSLGTVETKDTAVKDKEESKSQPVIKNTVWEYPPIDLFNDPSNTKVDLGNTEERKKVIEKTLGSFSIKSQVVAINPGPSVTQYAIRVDEGTKTSKITNLQNDLALALASPNGQVRIEAPIPGKSLIGIEVPNVVQQIVYAKPMLQGPVYKKQIDKSKLALVLGKDVGGNDVYYALNKMPHLLIAGATGSGKSVMIQSIITSILFANSPDECKFIMVDPKRVELTEYNDIPHLITPVITEPGDAVSALAWVVAEMEKRLQTFSNFGARNIEAYNQKSGFQAMPYIVVILDELADLMMVASNDVERYIVRIAQLSRATGIHLVLATQRPSTNIITGSIKANVPARISFNVASQVDSRVIIDTGGAEKLLGNGDMLFVSPESSKPVRIQGVWASDEEIGRLVNYLKASNVEPEYIKEVISAKSKDSATGEAKWEDDLFPDAVKVVCEYGRGSASLLQRRLSIGYARAARLLDELEENGVVSSSEGSKSREVLVDSSEEVLG